MARTRKDSAQVQQKHSPDHRIYQQRKLNKEEDVPQGKNGFYCTWLYVLNPQPSQLTLTTDVTTTDFHMGYCMSGCLERSVKKCSDFSQTHLAFVKRVSDLDQFRSTNLVPIQHHSSTTPLWHHVRQSMSLFRSGLRQCLAKSRGYFRLNTSS